MAWSARRPATQRVPVAVQQRVAAVLTARARVRLRAAAALLLVEARQGARVAAASPAGVEAPEVAVEAEAVEVEASRVGAEASRAAAPRAVRESETARQADCLG